MKFFVPASSSLSLSLSSSETENKQAWRDGNRLTLTVIRLNKKTILHFFVLAVIWWVAQTSFLAAVLHRQSKNDWSHNFLKNHGSNFRNLAGSYATLRRTVARRLPPPPFASYQIGAVSVLFPRRVPSERTTRDSSSSTRRAVQAPTTPLVWKTQTNKRNKNKKGHKQSAPIDNQPDYGLLRMTFFHSNNNSNNIIKAPTVVSSAAAAAFTAPARIIWDYGGSMNNKDGDDDVNAATPGRVAMDDDYRIAVDKQSPENHRHCRRTSFERKHHRPNCNVFQEVGLDSAILATSSLSSSSEQQAKFFDAGSMVDVFRVMDGGQVPVILKGVKYRGQNDFGTSYSMWYQSRKDAMIAAAVSPHPLIVSNYGYCGLNALSEYMPHGRITPVIWNEEDDPFCPYRHRHAAQQKFPLNITQMQQEPTVIRANNLTAVQKLHLSLEMAEALALLHNHPDGVLVHSDVWLDQFLRQANNNHGADAGDDKTEILHVKLNDFNNGEILQFDPTTQSYCPIRKEFGVDYAVAPEETSGVKSGEARDIFRFGDNLYYILTGYDLFPTACSSSAKYRMLSRGQYSYLDPRWKQQTNGEGVLARLIGACWKTDPKMRPSIGTIIRQLRTALQRHSSSSSSSRGTRK